MTHEQPSRADHPVRQPGQDLQGRRPRGGRPAGPRPARRSGRDDRPRRRLRQRQVDAHEHPRRPRRALGRASDRGRARPDPHGRPGQDGVPASRGRLHLAADRAQPARSPLGRGERRAAHAPRRRRRPRAPPAGHAPDGPRRGAGRPPRRPAGRAERRRAAARGGGHRARQPAPGAPGRRADRRARRHHGRPAARRRSDASTPSSARPSSS